MPLNLLQICTRALDEISSFSVPTLICGNDDDDVARTLLACAHKVGEELVRDHDWQEMDRDATVTTVADQASYDLEADYERLSPDTVWESQSGRRIAGQTTKRRWAAILSLNGIVDGQYRFRIYRGQIQLTPTPGGVFTFDYAYKSNRYCTDAAGVERERWLDDTDLPILPADLFIAGIRYYFLKAKTLPYGGAEAEWSAILDSRKDGNTPSEAINMADAVFAPGGRYDGRYLNIPDRIDAV